MSKIIFLNGCGSSGKTSIAKAIGHESRELWLSFGVDTFIDMISFGRIDPYLKFIPGQNEHGPTMHVESGPEGGKLFSVMPQFAEMLATCGHNLIIDEVLFDEETLKAYAKHLKDISIIQLTTNKKRTSAKHFYEKLGFEASHEGMKLYLRKTL